MWALLFLILVCALSGGAKWAMDAYNVLEVADPSSGELSRTVLGIEIHSHLGRIVRVSFVLAIWTTIDLLWLPWLKIEDVATGGDDWHGVAPPVRAAVVAGWFIALGSFLVSFSLGI